MKILITVPHAKCPIEYHPNQLPDNQTHNHPCDFIAKNVAEALSQKLIKKRHSVQVIIGDKLRLTEVDLNRPAGRNTEFRQKIDRSLEGVNLLIDCHSYPKNSVKFQKHELVVLKSPYDKTELTKNLFNILNELGLNVGFMAGFTRDCILNDMTHKGIPTVVIEHNEDCDIAMLTDFESEAINELLTGKKSKIATILKVLKESF